METRDSGGSGLNRQWFIFSLVSTPSLQPNVLVNTKVLNNKEINKLEGKINILKRIFTRPLSAVVSIAK